MRLFTALELSDEAREHLAKLARRLGPVGGRGLGFVRPENLHVTLKFLGEVEEERVELLRRALESVVSPEVGPLFADRAELLPPRGGVRVIAAGLGGDAGSIRRLFRAVEDACAGLGIEAERREFRPHVTLVRVRVSMPSSSREHLSDVFAADLPGPPFRPTDFVLFRSELKPGGPVYTPLARFTLGRS